MTPRIRELAQPGPEPALADVLAATAELHHHLCPRQVLGARLARGAGAALGLRLPQPLDSKRLLVIAETDGCFADGLAVAANCWVGRRTLRLEDYGKIAATFLDKDSGRAVRLAPHPEARRRALAAVPEARHRWEGYLLGYQRLADEALFTVAPVTLARSAAELMGVFGRRVICAQCGEEVFHGREVAQAAGPLCLACARPGYYQPAAAGPATRPG